MLFDNKQSKSFERSEIFLLSIEFTKGDMYCTYHAVKRKGEDSEEEKIKEVASLHKKIPLKDGLWRGQTPGTTGFENCSHDTKRRLRTTSVWCNYHAVSSSTER